ncbi:hypothetical protein PFISCL1PPCAC_19977, partial [Pristionchus fissidentatus]
FKMNESKRRELELKLERLQGHLISHKMVIIHNEMDDITLQRIELIQNQLETSLSILLTEVHSQSDLRVRLTSLKEELLQLHARINTMKKQRSTLMDEQSDLGSNIYEEPDFSHCSNFTPEIENVPESQARILRQQRGNGGMVELAREVHDKALVTQQLERDIRDIESIFHDLNQIVQEQGETVDSIEEGIESAFNDVKRGQRDVRKAVENQGTNTVITAAIVGGVVVGGPVGVAAGSTIMGALGALGGVVTGLYGGNWLNKQAKRDAVTD